MRELLHDPVVLAALDHAFELGIHVARQHQELVVALVRTLPLGGRRRQRADALRVAAFADERQQLSALTVLHPLPPLVVRPELDLVLDHALLAGAAVRLAHGPSVPGAAGAESSSSSRSRTNQASFSAYGTAALAGDVDGRTNSGRPSSRRSCRPCPGRSLNAPAYACLPTNAKAPGRSSRAIRDSRSWASAKSMRRSSPLPRVTRRAAFVTPSPSSSRCCSSLGSSSRRVRPASASRRQKSFRGFAKWCPASAERIPGLMPTSTHRRSGARMSCSRLGTVASYGTRVARGGGLLGRVLRLRLLAADAGDAVVG